MRMIEGRYVGGTDFTAAYLTRAKRFGKGLERTYARVRDLEDLARIGGGPGGVMSME